MFKILEQYSFKGFNQFGKCINDPCLNENVTNYIMKWDYFRYEFI